MEAALTGRYSNKVVSNLGRSLNQEEAFSTRDVSLAVTGIDSC